MGFFCVFCNRVCRLVCRDMLAWVCVAHVRSDYRSWSVFCLPPNVRPRKPEYSPSTIAVRGDDLHAGRWAMRSRGNVIDKWRYSNFRFLGRGVTTANSICERIALVGRRSICTITVLLINCLLLATLSVALYFDLRASQRSLKNAEADSAHWKVLASKTYTAYLYAISPTDDDGSVEELVIPDDARYEGGLLLPSDDFCDDYLWQCKDGVVWL